MDVLLIEDEALIREVLEEDLADAGLDVLAAPNAEEALVAAERAAPTPAVVVTDVNLGPGMDGLTFAQEARRRWPAVGIVVMTADPRTLRTLTPSLHDRCLLKPFPPPRLLTEINMLMGRSCR